MIKEIVKDREFLSKPAEEATVADAEVVQDLRDTLESLDDAVYALSQSIGSTKAVIAYRDGDRRCRDAQPQDQARRAALQDAGELPVARGAERGAPLPDGHRVVPGALGREPREPHEAPERVVAEVVQHAIDHCAGKLV